VGEEDAYGIEREIGERGQDDIADLHHCQKLFLSKGAGAHRRQEEKKG
jgi:hypothetical protein